MTLELTTEQIVTNLLSSNEILKHKKENFYISNCPSLGEYLKNLSIDIEEQETLTNTTPQLENDDTKYTFIKKTGWKY